MKLKCLIVDDEPLAHNVIIEYAEALPYIEIVEQAYMPTTALQILKATSIDLIFLDIQMPKLNGLEMLRLLDTQPEVIITSAYEEFALESYELNVCDYLLKPFRLDRFIQAVDKAFENHKQRHSNSIQTDNFILVKSNKKYIQLSKDDLYFIESYGNYVKIWTEQNYIVTMRTLSSFEKELEGNGFCKIHKSYIINKNYIEFLEGNSVTMKNKKTLPVSKNYKQNFMQFING